MIKDLKKLDAVLANIIKEATEAREMIKETKTAKVEEPKVEVKPTITLEDVRKLLTEKSRDGKTADVKALLKKHNANKLSEVNPSEYVTLLKEAEEL
jgi:hypothetical protein